MTEKKIKYDAVGFLIICQGLIICGIFVYYSPLGQAIFGLPHSLSWGRTGWGLLFGLLFLTIGASLIEIPPKIFVHPPSATVISYNLNGGTQQEAEKKIYEILSAKPDADLKKFEDALGIKILTVQRGAPTKPQQPNRDIFIGQ